MPIISHTLICHIKIFLTQNWHVCVFHYDYLRDITVMCYLQGGIRWNYIVEYLNI